MCLTCGCGDAHRVMGKNLTYEGLREMAVENGQTVDESLSILATISRNTIGPGTPANRRLPAPRPRSVRMLISCSPGPAIRVRERE